MLAETEALHFGGVKLTLTLVASVPVALKSALIWATARSHQATAAALPFTFCTEASLGSAPRSSAMFLQAPVTSLSAAVAVAERSDAPCANTRKFPAAAPSNPNLAALMSPPTLKSPQ